MNHSAFIDARILIVEDDRACLALYQNALKSLGYHNLLLLANPMEIMESLQEFQPDLVITDLEMPGLNGMCLMAIVQQSAPVGDFLPILVVTGHNSSQAKLDALEAGAADFLAKPCDLAELKARVGNLLQIRALQQETRAQNRELERTITQRTYALGKALVALKEVQGMTVRR